ncbi:MAG TPA: universal stress protein [Desulfomonilaceae bacterium]|nr:universal stress protein [Desulfomonilaceae bacterium]
MGKRVLVAVDMNSESHASILYGIELAARIECSVVLIAISSPASPGKGSVPEASRGYVGTRRDTWMDRVVAESQHRAVGLEIFVALGRFFEEIIRFIRSQPSVQFIVMSAPKQKEGKDGAKFAAALKGLQKEFEGEILLVEKAGQITRVSDLYLRTPAGETSA